MTQVLTVGIAGLGAIGLHLARALDAGVQGLRLAAVSARDLKKAQANIAGFKVAPMVVPNAELAACDVVVEAAPAAAFEEIAKAETVNAADRTAVSARCMTVVPPGDDDRDGATQPTDKRLVLSRVRLARKDSLCAQGDVPVQTWSARPDEDA